MVDKSGVVDPGIESVKVQRRRRKEKRNPISSYEKEKNTTENIWAWSNGCKFSGWADITSPSDAKQLPTFDEDSAMFLFNSQNANIPSIKRSQQFGKSQPERTSFQTTKTIGPESTWTEIQWCQNNTNFCSRKPLFIGALYITQTQNSKLLGRQRG